MRSIPPAGYALGAAFLFGISIPLAKLLIQDADPIPLAALLYLGSGMGLAPVLLYQVRSGRTREAALSRPDLPWLFAATLAGGVAAPILLLYGLSLTPASTASLLLNLEAVATAFLGTLFFHEEIGRRVWAGILLLLIGAILLSWSGGEWGISLGALGVLSACVLWGLDNNLTCAIANKNPLMIALGKGWIAGGITSGIGLLSGASLPPFPTLLAGLLLGITGYGFSTVLFVRSLRLLGSARTTSYFSTAPFLGAFISLVIFPTLPGGLFLAALAFMGGGMYFLTREEHVHRHLHPPLVHDHRHRHDDLHHLHPASGEEEHAHPHIHPVMEHEHPHAPDTHHRHEKEKE
jgi:drug/metabolite transporter (DMT)-like permease